MSSDAGLSVEQRVRNLVAGLLGLGVAQVLPRARFMDELGVDDLDAAELLMEVEDVFGCQVSDDDAAQMISVQDLIRFVAAFEAGPRTIHERHRED